MPQSAILERNTSQFVAVVCDHYIGQFDAAVDDAVFDEFRIALQDVFEQGNDFALGEFVMQLEVSKIYCIMTVKGQFCRTPGRRSSCCLRKGPR